MTPRWTRWIVAVAVILVGWSGVSTETIQAATSWRQLFTGLPDTAQFSGLACPKPRFCIAVGTSYAGAPPAHTLIELFDGSKWKAMPGPVLSAGGFAGVSCSSPTSCIAVGGHFGSPGAIWSNVIESFDGKVWTMAPVATPDPYTEFTSVSCTSSGFCMAVERNGPSFLRNTPLSPWRQVPMATPHGTVNSIFCASPKSCVAVGAIPQYRRGDIAEELIESFNGKTWSVSSNPRGPNTQLSAVSCPSVTFCVAVGGSSFEAADPSQRFSTPGGGRSSQVQN